LSPHLAARPVRPPTGDAMMRSGFALSLSLALGGTAPALAQQAKIADGREIALKVCAVCHVVADDQAVAPTLKPSAPSFAEIAARPNVTEAFLRDFLTKPHGQARALSAMPGFLMPSYQADAAIAYLMSLKPAK
jgi:mono/diheme cytochrome c family protein